MEGISLVAGVERGLDESAIELLDGATKLEPRRRGIYWRKAEFEVGADGRHYDQHIVIHPRRVGDEPRPVRFFSPLVDDRLLRRRLLFEFLEHTPGQRQIRPGNDGHLRRALLHVCQMAAIDAAGHDRDQKED